MILSPSVPQEPIYRLRATTTTDSYGDPVEGWDAPLRTLLKGARAQDAQTDETEASDRRTIAGVKTLFIPGTADLTEDDRVEIAGLVWRVNGEPTVRKGLGSATFTTATLTRVSG